MSRRKRALGAHVIPLVRRTAVAAAGAAVAALVGAALLAPTASASVRRITVHTGGDVNAAIASAKPGDTVFLQTGEYRGPVRVDKPIVLESLQATVRAPAAGTAVSVTADGVTIDSVGTTCADASGATRGIRVTSNHVRIVNSSAVQCHRGIVLDGAAGAYLHSDALLGRAGASGTSTGVWADRADDLTMLDNTFQSNDTGMLVQHTDAPALDANTFVDVGTGIDLRSVSNAVVDSTVAVHVSHAAVSISGSRGVEVSALDRTASGGGKGTAIALTALDGPSSVVNVENSDLGHFAVGISAEPSSISGTVTVMSSAFQSVTRTAVEIAPRAGGRVDATFGDYFGGCGPGVPDHGYDGGGARIDDPGRLVSYREQNCGAGTSTSTGPTVTSGAAGSATGGATPTVSPTPPAVPAPTASSTEAPEAVVGGHDGHDGHDDGTAGIPAQIGSALVTVGVALLLMICAGGVLYTVRRNRDLH
ncbi:right-handed parallel beta-helix repeat-containing protein [Humibacter albus]|uniref:right-handed parallel beta-helix repeat-containing protein n=1 Tax=Humibacter albus TaxID=427754 RepID=UPI0003B6CDA6|nr:NosD domain-containing protein [Humibacter albus]